VTVYESHHTRIVEMLQQAPSVAQAMDTSAGEPRNLVSGKGYRASMSFSCRRCALPRLLVTYRQPPSGGGRRDKGCPVVFWRWSTQG